MNNTNFPYKSIKFWFWTRGKSNSWNIWNNIVWIVIMQTLQWIIIITLFVITSLR